MMDLYGFEALQLAVDHEGPACSEALDICEGVHPINCNCETCTYYFTQKLRSMLGKGTR